MLKILNSCADYEGGLTTLKGNIAEPLVICNVTPTSPRFLTWSLIPSLSLSSPAFVPDELEAQDLAPATGQPDARFSELTAQVLNRKKGTVRCHMCVMINRSERPNAGAVCTWRLCVQISWSVWIWYIKAYIYMYTHYAAHQCAGTRCLCTDADHR